MGFDKLLVLISFLLIYILLMVLPKYRAYIALAGATFYILFGVVTFGEALNYINWNVIMMIAGTMGTVHFFIESKMPALMAEFIISKTPNVKWAIIALSLFAGIISAFIDNVATVLMVAPIALTISNKLKISPVSSIIAIAIASNLQGAATLVGDTTSILLAGVANMNFFDFFWFLNRPGMFFVVQAGALVATLYLLWIFRKDTLAIKTNDKTEVKDYVPSYLLGLTILFLIIASFIPNAPENINGYICMVLYGVGILHHVIRKESNLVKKSLQEIDYFTLLLLTGLFVVIGGITEIGLVADLSHYIGTITNNIFLLYTIIVWLSVLLSAFIDNIPYIATMLPVIAALGADLGHTPYVLYFGLLAGATLGGNLTPIGASANIAGLGILKRAGYDVKPLTFMKMAVPYTLLAVFTGYVLIWVLYV